ncbi:hypothetical protein NLG97_g7562 [Lecanicillium saksenae]|uniref:Uncharacterized protein n=1 Tax=Lecanicillium saksenae TaxID=468837 RepID=A0ACC1QN10_9HYPO|nr:hypothetical protein NLG97_g7562 [Lecanicillium saksenae]
MIDDVNCWPPRATSVPPAPTPIGGWGFYSPGPACPSGYTAACTGVYDQRPEFDFQFSLYSGETALGCCPTGYQYDCVNFAGHNGCHVVGNGTTATTATCRSGTSYDSGVYAFPDTTSYYTSSKGGSSSLVTTTRVGKLFASMFQLNYKSTGPPATATSSGPAETEASSTGGSSKSGGLSNGAVAGIAVGATLGGLMLLAVAFFAIRRHRRKRLGSSSVPTPELKFPSTQEAHLYQQPGLERNDANAGWVRHELPTETAAPAELPAERL